MLIFKIIKIMKQNIFSHFTRYKNLLSSVSLVVLFRAFGAGIGFLSGVIITRYLGISESGYYFYSVDLITSIALVAGLGFNNLLLRDVASTNNEESSSARQFWLIFKIVMITTIPIIALITIFKDNIGSFVDKPSISNILLVLSPMLLLIPLNSYLVTYLQAKKLVISSSIVQFAIPYSAITLLVVLITPSDAFTTSLIHISALIFTTLSAFILSRKYLFTQTSVKVKPLKGWQPFLIMHLINSLCVMFISLINGYYLTPEEFSILTAASRFTLLISFCLIAFNFVSAPTYAKLYNEGKHEELATFAQSITRMLLVIITPISILVLYFTNELMEIYGAEFSAYGYILSILLIGQIINAATGSVVYLLTLSGHEKDMKNITLIVAPLNVLASLILTINFGLIGITTSMMLMAISLNVSAYVLVKKRLGFYTIKWKSKIS